MDRRGLAKSTALLSAITKIGAGKIRASAKNKRVAYRYDQGAVYIYSGPDDVAPFVVQPPASSVDHVEFGYSVAYASGKFVVGARELGDDKIGAAFLYSL